MNVRPFAAVRPPRGLETEVTAPPYDVLDSVEAKKMAGEKSLLHVNKPEIDFDPILPDHDQRVYDRAVRNFKLWRENGWLVQDPKPCYYVYAQRMGERTQYGLVLCANTEDYMTGKIKKHELTRKDKEDDRMIHVRIQNANIEPVFFAYKDNPELLSIMMKAAGGTPEYDFTDENGLGGVTVRLKDNVLFIVDGTDEKPVFELDLRSFDGGPFCSVPEEERDGKIALAKTIIENDRDEDRIAEARTELERLNAMKVPGIADGAEPYIPVLDIDEEGKRDLRIRLDGGKISVWLDNTLVADALAISDGAGNGLFLEAVMSRQIERFSQTNLSDDVYDGIFSELSIKDLDGNALYNYAEPIPAIFRDGPVSKLLDKLLDKLHWLNLQWEY